MGDLDGRIKFNCCCGHASGSAVSGLPRRRAAYEGDIARCLELLASWPAEQQHEFDSQGNTVRTCGPTQAHEQPRVRQRHMSPRLES